VTILLTGYEAFADWYVNPTAIAVETLNGLTIGEHHIEGRVLPLRYKEIRPTLSQLVTQIRPDAILLSGQTGGDKIRLEQQAFNWAEAKVPYNCGTLVTGEELVAGATEILTSGLPLQQMEQNLRDHHIPVRLSDTAGRFGCNQVFYYARLDFPGIPSGFVHVPSLPEQVAADKPSMPQQVITTALKLCLEVLAEELSQSSQR